MVKSQAGDLWGERTQHESRCVEEASKTWRESDTHNGRQIKSPIAERRLIEKGKLKL